ncbi:MAG: hypothetical protein ACYSTN_06265 [Planctomycetota bacterium]
MRRTRGQERRGAKVVVVWEWSGDWASDGGGVWAGRGAEKIGCSCYEWLGDMRGILGCFCGSGINEYRG